MFMGTGVAFAWGAGNYRVGDASQMGPGYFPLLLGVLLTLLGTIITFKSLVVETEDRGRMGLGLATLVFHHHCQSCFWSDAAGLVEPAPACPWIDASNFCHDLYRQPGWT